MTTTTPTITTNHVGPGAAPAPAGIFRIRTEADEALARADHSESIEADRRRAAPMLELEVRRLELRRALVEVERRRRPAAGAEEAGAIEAERRGLLAAIAENAKHVAQARRRISAAFTAAGRPFATTIWLHSVTVEARQTVLGALSPGR